jgi:hypothetical protein
MYTEIEIIGINEKESTPEISDTTILGVSSNNGAVNPHGI